MLRSRSPLPLSARPGRRTFRSGLWATPLRRLRVPCRLSKGVSLLRGSLLSTLRLRVAIPRHSCCSRLASTSTPSFRTKLALPLRPSSQACWLLPLVLRSALKSSRPLSGEGWSGFFRKGSTAMRVRLFCTLSRGVAGRTSRLALASKLPLPRLPRSSSTVSKPARLLALRLILLKFCCWAVSWSRLRLSCRSSLRSSSIGSSGSRLQACWVGALGDGELAGKAAVVQLQLQVFEVQAVVRAGQAGNQLELAEGLVIIHRRQFLAA